MKIPITVDPCFCDQSKAYEKLLREVVKFWRTINELELRKLSRTEKQMLKQIENIIHEYEGAQFELELDNVSSH